MALAKRQKGSFPEFCYRFNKAFGFFSLGQYLKLILKELIHSTSSMLTITYFNGDVILLLCTLPLPVIQILI
jgi:hypothetical protein